MSAIHPDWRAMLAEITDVGVDFDDCTVILNLPSAEQASEMGRALADLVRDCRGAKP